MKKLISLALVFVLVLACVFTVAADETEAEIVDAAFELEQGKSTSEAKTLTGVVTAIVTPYSTQFENVTVNISVKNSKGEDKTIQCFRMKGEDAATVDVGDKITVTGKIKNYNGTIEFDAGSTFVTVKKGTGSKPLETEAEILEAAFALENNTALSGTYSLTGVVTEIVTEFSAEYGNVTVNYKVSDKTIQCYRLVAESADDVGVGDKITVTGALKNFRGTVEFDAGCTFVMVEKAPESATSQEVSEEVSEDVSEETSEEPAVQLTEPEIVDAAFALEKGKALEGTYTLTGKVSGMVAAYSDANKNVSVNMKVTDSKGKEKIIQCYLMKGEDAATVGINDEITVTGTIKNYNDIVEFDKGCTFVTAKKGTPPAAPKTEQEILDAAFALPQGEIIPGTYSLTGVVTERTETNTQITISVGDKTILCFKLDAQDFEGIGVGDTITVTGSIKNYNGTVEFNAGCTAEINQKAEPGENGNETSSTDEPGAGDTSGPETTNPTTEKEILAAAFALEKGASLEGTYSLTGTVTEIVTEYNEQYGNVTVKIEVGGKTLQCFRMKAADAAAVGVGDKITVTGEIHNFNGTVEFSADCTYVMVRKASQNTPQNGDAGVIVIVVVGVIALAGGALLIKKVK